MVAAVLAGCTGEGPTLGSLSSGGAETTTAALQQPGATPDAPAAYNPFSEQPASSVGRREVMENPSIADVMQAGELPEMALGRKDAPVTIVQYASMTCPYCRQFQIETFPVLKKEYIDTGKVRLVFRDFLNTNHPEAGIAAMAAECADDQGKYWEYHDKLFQEQDRRGHDVVRFRANDLKRWATEIGVEPKQFNQCFDSAKYKNETEKDFSDALGVGLNGTPVFFINGRALFCAYPFADFKRVIDEEFAK